ncbi:MAG: DUF4390 domain-containing protein [Guyparkeria sp.]|uniref:DUF4390 domain-containing protein n=1 Tax=Guyparkeria sp. TaxID=2035736 RepID=UPI0039789F70
MISARASRLGWLLLLFAIGLGGTSGLHADARVIDVHAEVREDSLFLDANLELSLGDEVIDALRNSIALNLLVEAEIVEPREWLWDRALLNDRRRLRLEYHALSRTWMVTDFHARETHTFSQLADAVESLSRVRAWRLGNWASLADRPRLLGKLRVTLDVNKLPLPLRVPALFDDNWDLDSDWFLWGLSEVRR